jgi:phospholipid/cholesterol/gamma-HCH transport system substrate-binding protein
MFALALVILALGVMAVGDETGWLRERADYTIALDEADGLLVGAPVKMAGVQIGNVADIRLPTDPAQAGITVRVSIDESYQPRVREDSRAALRILQLLTNEKYVEITPGAAGEQLPAGSEIPRLEERGVFEQGERIAENLNEITIALRNILEPMQRGEGLLGRLLTDPEFGKRGVEAFGRTLENLEQLTDDVRAGKGAAGKLLYDEELAARVDDLGRAIADLSGLLADLRREDGFFGSLVAEGGAGEQLLADAQAAVAALERFAARLESDDGLVGRLVNDPVYGEAVAGDLGQTLQSLAEITDKINRGEGTLGALLSDRTLYDSAEEIVAGVNDSKFARWLLRHYRKKGIKAGEGEVQPAPAPAEEPVEEP